MNGASRSDPGDGRPLGILMFGYCFFRKGAEPAIGVYKRLLRIGVELLGRGHRVDMNIVHLFDDERYTDPLVEQAAGTPGFAFVDLPIRDITKTPEAANWNFHCYSDCIADLRPDVVVLGEVPLYGDLLAQSLAAAQSGVPVVMVDNTYSRLSVEWMRARHGPIADGLLLVGPSSHEAQPAPADVFYAPPFTPSPGDLGRPAVDGLAAEGPTMTVLGYDPAVRRLGLELAGALGADCGQVVVVGPDPTGTENLATTLGLADKVLPLPPPPEDLLFALLRGSRLAVVKGGFMQVTECLSLGTPVVAYRYGGSFSIGLIPEGSRRFIVAAQEASPAADLVAAVRSLLAHGRAVGVHEGPLGGVAAAAGAVERVARAGRRSGLDDCESLGVSPAAVSAALRSWWGEATELVDLRCTHVKGDESYDAYATVAHTDDGTASRSTVLLCRVCRSPEAAAEAGAKAGGGLLGEAHVAGRLLVERWQHDDGYWPGEHALPWAKRAVEAAR